MIANSAQRASLVPSVPRISVYISKTNFTHDMVYRSGVFGVHLLRTDQWNLIWHLGLQSARDADKLSTVPHHLGKLGCPLLEDCAAAWECKVINAMDAGAATFFLGDVVSTHTGRAGEVMTSEYFRANISPERKEQYEARLLVAQGKLEPLAREIRKTVWTGLE
jgi:flavin reductase (DIM6/NTAB) family NADH-FMN oxidoreductase RutF